MIRGTLTTLSAFSILLFPWPLSLLLVLSAATVEPLVPLAAGIFADTLYYSAPGLPLATILGALTTLVSYVVRARLNMSSMRE